MFNIIDILREIRPEEDFQKSGNFVCDGMLDSFDIISLVAELDNRYNISIQGTDIIPENFSSIQAIENLVKKTMKY